VVRVDPAASTDYDVARIEERLAAAIRSWDDDFAEALVDLCGEEASVALARRYEHAFPEAYKEDFAARTAVVDLRRLEDLTSESELAMSLYEPAGAPPGERRFKICKIGAPLSLTSVLPILQRMGVEVMDERPYGVVRKDGTTGWVYDFGLRYDASRLAQPAGSPPGGGLLEGQTERVQTSSSPAEKELFQEAFAAVWRGDAESDGFNALVLLAGLSWQEAMILRGYAKYLRQGTSTFSQDYMEQALTSNPRIARLLARLFAARLDPALDGRVGEFAAGSEDGATERRAELAAGIVEEIEGALEGVSSLDQDRILRAFLAVIQATLRTNFFQHPRGAGPPATSRQGEPVEGRPEPHFSVKLDPRRVPDLPEPRPRYEIWVYSPRLEGVHLRFGPVARGGLRWSDRREDFRTEILGLVKAQMVKNAVIVPVGAKGGFVVKRPADPSDREAWLAEGIACYRTFIGGLLDLTDNLVGGEVVPPPQVVRHDGDDPYLVVAADKGTATFSDIANEVAKEYGFWLGDAFASGGSAGYDHKAMGITARGAWESVKRHFREMGVDCQRQDFTAVGIGDMSGDVFGNGMLLSDHTRLVAAFDHRHIILDPNPDPAASYAERRRLFELPRSSWADYNPELISSGGGVYPRTAKSIPVTPQVRQRLGILPVQRRCGRQGERRRPGRRRRTAVQVRGRGREPRVHPARADRVRVCRRAHQHRRDRQLCRRRYLRPRGQHQDPPRRDGAGRRAHRATPQRPARRDDERCRRARPAEQLRPECRAGKRTRSVARDAARPRETHAAAGARRAARPRPRVAAHRPAGQGATAERSGPHGTGGGRAARVCKDQSCRGARWQRPPGRPGAAAHALRLLPGGTARRPGLCQADRGASAAPPDHHDRAGEQRGQRGRHVVHLPPA
jgi:glutamate dehydrogenase